MQRAKDGGGGDPDYRYNSSDLEHPNCSDSPPFRHETLNFQIEPVAAIACRLEDPTSDKHFKLGLMDMIRRFVSDSLAWIERTSFFEMFVNLTPGARHCGGDC